jgi:hypothetical protein
MDSRLDEASGAKDDIFKGGGEVGVCDGEKAKAKEKARSQNWLRHEQ